MPPTTQIPVTVNINSWLVKEFHNTSNLPIRKEPTLASVEEQELRVGLIEEELEELKKGIEEEDIVEVADALADLLYVVYGAALTFGINIDQCFWEVHRSNMTKFGPNGEVYYNELGKVIKGPDYEPPRLEPILGIKDKTD